MMSLALKNLIGGFHGSVERFFENRRKEANPLFAVLAFVLVASVFSLWTIIPSHSTGDNPEFIQLKLQAGLGQAQEKPIAAMPLVLLLFGVPIMGIWLAAVKLLKSKSTWDQIMYCLSFSLLSFAIVAFMALFVDLYVPQISFLLLVWLFVLVPYLNIVAMKVSSRINYGQVVVMIFVIWLLWNLAQALIYAVYFPFVFVPQLKANAADSIFNFTITDHNDGSFTATYTTFSNKTGEIKEQCTVRFPSGWGYGNTSIMSVLIEKEKNRALRDYDIYNVFYKMTDNGSPGGYLVFEYPPGFSFSFMTSKGLKYWEEKKSKNPLIELVNFSNIESTGAEVLDVKYKNENKTLTRHEIRLVTTVKLGYEAVYQSPYGKDEDLSYILSNSVCHK